MIELSYFVAFIFVFVSCIRLLHMNSSAEWPELFSNGTDFVWKFGSDHVGFGGGNTDQRTQDESTAESFVTQILKHAPIFSRPYIPPLIWGRSGHLQTIIHSTLSRHKTPREKGDSRHAIYLSDGSMLTFDLFLPPSELLQSTDNSKIVEDATLVVCPGIGNSSETVALRAFSHHANEQGYRVAVLNHLGIIPSIPLTSARIFSYGSTEEYGAMVKEVKSMYPDSKLVAVGFSMGGNIVCKYLGESAEQRANFVAGISCCQGYNITKSMEIMLTGKHWGNAYLRAVCICVQKVLHNFQDVLLSDEMLQRYNIHSKYEILYSSDLMHLDNTLLCKLAGYEHFEDYYRLSSSSMYIPQIDIPMLFINAKDDPLIPPDLFDTPLQHTAINDRALFVVTKHGGHLGFYECQEGSRFFSRGTYTWLDKAVVQYVGAVIIVTASAVQPKSVVRQEEISEEEANSKRRTDSLVMVNRVRTSVY